MTELKISMAQIDAEPMDIAGNRVKIMGSIDRARQVGSDLVILPELSTTGYSCMDRFHSKKLINENDKLLDEVLKYSDGIGVILGFVEKIDQIGPNGFPILFNSAALIDNKKILGTVQKSLIPTYSVFEEARHFTSGTKQQVFNFRGFKLGIGICEDLWSEHYQTEVYSELTKLGAELLINISASPYEIGKLAKRYEQIQRVVKSCDRPMLYVNTVGSQDGYDGQIVFDGRSMAVDRYGRVINVSKFLETDNQQIRFGFGNLIGSEVELTEPSEIEQMIKATVKGIQDYCRQSGRIDVVIGLSGGIDSALVAALAVEALGADHVTGVLMPSEYSSKGSVTDAQKLVENLKIKSYTLPINDTFQSFLKMMEPVFGDAPLDVTEENAQARIRGLALMGISNKKMPLLLTTGNKTEMALGYCTLYGDMAGGLAPISDYDKLRVYEAARFINKKAGFDLIPKNTIEKAPSAELAPGQTDEASLGSYDIISPMVTRIIEDMAESEELYQDYPKDLVDATMRRYQNNIYKSRQAPPGIRLTKLSIGLNRRLPMNAKLKI